MELHERLEHARKKAGYKDASEAARAFGWTISTYVSHENGTRGLRPEVARRYAKAYKVNVNWLLYEEGKPTSTATPRPAVRSVPVVGKVGAGARAFFFDDQGDLDEVDPPTGTSDETVAVEVEGDSMGSSFNGWLVFYDDVHRPVRDNLLGHLCVVGLDDGRILVKTLRRARGKPGLFHLLSNNEPPITDVEVQWAAKVRLMKPRD